MSYWNGTEWVVDAPPDPKRPSRVKRVAAATLEAALVTALTFGLIAGTAFAGKGGNGGKPGGGGTCHGKNCTPTTTASVAVTPNPVSAYSEFGVTGCGYTPGGGVQFNLYSAGGTAVWGGTADSTGCLYNIVGWANAPGSARLDVLANSTTLVASTTFTIQ